MPNLKLALRTLVRTPFVSSVAIVSLALGIGANAAIFSLFNQILLRPLPVVEPDRLVNLGAPPPKPGGTSCNNAGACSEVFSYPMFRDLQAADTPFTAVAAHRAFGANLAYGRQTISAEAMLVSGTYFPLLGLQPALGRLLRPEDDRAIGQSPVAVLSYAYWQTGFGADPEVLNEALIVNGQAMTIVGVAPRGFDGTTLGTKPLVFVPITMRPILEPLFGERGLDNRRNYWVYLFARLKPGVSIEQARAAVNAPYRAIINDIEAPLQEGMSDQTMARFRAKEITVEGGRRGQSSVHREGRAPLVLLLSVTGLVLVIACANIANLLLARAAGRSAEMAVRLSIGAGRRHLVTQLLVESCLLAAFGGAAGLAVARWTLNGIASILPAEALATLDFTLDPAVLGFTAGLAIGTGLLFGLFPALHSTRPDLAAALKGQTGQPSAARSASRVRVSLATTQIALSMALLVAAGLFTRSLWNVSRVELGIRTDHLVTFRISPLLNAYTPERSRALFERLEEELASLPGVTSVSASMVPLLAGSNWGRSVRVQGFEYGPDTDRSSRYNELAPGYFRTLGIPLVAGRDFAPADTAGAPKVAIVNEEFARKFNLGRETVGTRMSAEDKGELDMEIVGLVRNATYSEVKDEVPPQFFMPYRQGLSGFLTFYVRASTPPEQILSLAAKVVATLDPNLPVENLRTMEQQVRENVFVDRMISVLSAAFAMLATLLAAIGLYGVLTYAVSQRTREIGLRMALGADAGRVRRMVLRQVGWMTAIGGTLGLAGAVGLGRLARSLLFEVQAQDPAVLAGAAIMLALVALGAGFIPAHRASRIDPMQALRYE